MKKTKNEYFCALCRTPRKLRYSRHLTNKHFVQILMLALVFTALTFPMLSFKGAVSLPVIWVLFESIQKSLYRKDLKCPHCGFDPKWYRKDLKLARQKVEEFIQQNPESPIFKRHRTEEKTGTSLN